MSVWGTAAADSLVGTAGGDTFYGLMGDDQIRGYGGDDRLAGGGGNDLLDGGAGADVAVYAGASSRYAVASNLDGSVTVTDLAAGTPDGADRLVGVERIAFSDALLLADVMALML